MGKDYRPGMKRMLESIKQLRNHKGPIFKKWKARWEASTGLKLKPR